MKKHVAKPNSRPPSVASGPSSEPPAKPDFVAWGCLLITLGLVVAEPLQSTDLWWDLSRGRQVVLAGSIAPSRDLLAGEHPREAGWLGGVPGYLAIALAGLPGLFAWKLASVSAIAATLLRRPLRIDGRLLLLLTILLTTIGLWEGTARTIELLLFLVIRLAAVRWLKNPSLRVTVTWLGMQWLWANTGDLSILGVVMAAGVVAESLLRGKSWRRDLGLLVLLVLVHCGTPRGILTLRDSFLGTFPAIVADRASLAAVGWGPAWSIDGEWRLVVWGILSALGWIELVRAPRGVHTVVPYAAIQLAGWSCAVHLPWAMAASMVLLLHRTPVEAGVRSVAPISRWSRVAWCGSWLALVGALFWLDWPGFPRRVGSLLRPHLDPSLLAEAIHPLKLTGTAHATDTMSAGMLCWVRPTGPRPILVVPRTVVTGTVRSLALLNHELRLGFRDPYARSDGSWGGWWSTLQPRDVQLLLVRSEDLDLIRALEPTIWKPLSLDSPVLPYAQAGNPAVAERMVEVLQQRQLIESGPWNHVPSTLENDLRLARSLRALQLPMASLRILHATRRSGGGSRLRREFAATQLELGFRERVIAGRASDWRRAVYFALLPEEWQSRVARGALGIEESERAGSAAGPVPPWIASVLEPYLAGELDQARTAIRAIAGAEATPLAIYVAFLLALEAGDAAEVRQRQEQLQRDHPEHPWTLVSHNVLPP